MIRSLKKHVDWKNLEKNLGVKFKNHRYALAALTHPSYRNEMRLHNLLCFERMEFFGDAILNFTISEILYEKYKDGDEGMLSKLKSILVSGKILALISKKLKLKTFMLVGRSEKSHPDPDRAKIMADTFEAILAAIYFDRGLPVAQRFIKKQFNYYFSPKRLHTIGVSPKTTLQELSQKHLKMLPHYHSEFKKGNFICIVSLKKVGKGKGSGRTKKEAQEEAARELIEKFESKKVPTTISNREKKEKPEIKRVVVKKKKVVKKKTSKKKVMKKKKVVKKKAVVKKVSKKKVVKKKKK